MAYKQFQVNPPEVGWTLQRLLHDRLMFSHAKARGLLAESCVTCNRWVQKDPAIRVSLGDQIEVRYEPNVRYFAPKRAESQPLAAGDYVAAGRVLHVDEALVVIDKPSGLLSVHAPGSQRQDLKRRIEQRLGVHLFPVQRLDRYTTGVLAYARSKEAKEALVPQFRDHAVEREYIGVVVGVPTPQRATLRGLLVEDKRMLKVRLARPGEPGEEAITEYEVLEPMKTASRCRFRLQTGKKHQIRVQMAAIGHPLVGDRNYGLPSPLIARPALHAVALKLRHPLTGEWVRWEAPPPADFQRLLKRCRSGAAVQPSKKPKRSRKGTRGRRRRPRPPTRPKGTPFRFFR